MPKFFLKSFFMEKWAKNNKKKTSQKTKATDLSHSSLLLLFHYNSLIYSMHFQFTLWILIILDFSLNCHLGFLINTKSLPLIPSQITTSEGILPYVSIATCFPGQSVDIFPLHGKYILPSSFCLVFDKEAQQECWFTQVLSGF